jgi:hypothetical protein
MHSCIFGFKFEMGCDIHLYVEKKVNTDFSLRNLARLAIQRARNDSDTSDLIEKQLLTSDVPEEVLEYIEEEPPGKWINLHEHKVIRRDPDSVRNIHNVSRNYLEGPKLGLG